MSVSLEVAPVQPNRELVGHTKRPSIITQQHAVVDNLINDIQARALKRAQTDAAGLNAGRAKPKQCLDCSPECSLSLKISVVGVLAICAVGTVLYGLWFSLSGGSN